MTPDKKRRKMPVKHLHDLAKAQQQKAKAKKPAGSKLPAVTCEASIVDKKLVITLDLFEELIPSSSGKSVLLTSFNKYVTIKGLGLKARAGINVSVPAP
jgi:hypothetical protein